MSAPSKKTVSLALQGGGAHGAFTWGVLDLLLEDERIHIEAISGTSAGAMNAVALVDGWIEGKAEGARKQLDAFWHAVSQDARYSPIQRSAWDKFLGSWSLEGSIGYLWFDLFTRFASPYDFNPGNHNQIKELLNREISFENVRKDCDVKLFIAATNVHSGKIEVFAREKLTADHVMASACLPFLFQAVEIDGVPYWDGGYTGNPALFPLFYNAKSSDVVLVQINPVERKVTPRSARDIQNRLNEVSFNSSLLQELRSVRFVTRLIDDGKLSASEYKRVLMHRIAEDDALKPLDASTKLNAEWDFLLYLKNAGRSAAKRFLANHFDDLGQRSTLDLGDALQAPVTPSSVHTQQKAGKHPG